MDPMPKNLRILTWFTGVLFVVALYLALIFAPTEAVMGDVQRVFYFHLAAGWVGALAFLVAAVAGILLLIRRDRRWDGVALSSIEIGVVFALINIMSGSIWARSAWNTWWTWDLRLVTATVMELIYIAYLMLRQAVDDPDRRARFAAVYSILGFLSVPLTFLSIRIVRTIHPVAFASSDSVSSGVEGPKMLTALIFSVFTFTFVYMTLLWHRLRLHKLVEKLDMKKMKFFSS